LSVASLDENNIHSNKSSPCMKTEQTFYA